MTISIPSGVFDVFHEGVDAMYTHFGVDCTLVYMDEIEEVSSSFDNIPPDNSVHAHRRRKDLFEREDKVYETKEVRATVRMRVYWSQKDWVDIKGMVLPNNGIQTMFYATDLQAVLKAKELIVHNGVESEHEARYTRFADPHPFSFGRDRYYVCLWEQS